jgi:hypothetical protein
MDVLHAADHHIGREDEENEAPGDLEGAQRDADRGDDDLAEADEEHQHHQRDNGREPGDPAAGGGVVIRRQCHEGRHRGDGVDDDPDRQEIIDEVAKPPRHVRASAPERKRSSHDSVTRSPRSILYLRGVSFPEPPMMVRARLHDPMRIRRARAGAGMAGCLVAYEIRGGHPSCGVMRMPRG